MKYADVTRFQRLDQSGATVEYRTPSPESQTLAYIDYSADGATASCEVFHPHTGNRRLYEARPAARAEAIVARHLKAEGWSAQ